MINLKKGDAPVTLNKVSEVTVKMMWPNKTDYDLGAEILYQDGTTESIAMFGAGALPVRQESSDGSVRHSGDVGRGWTLMGSRSAEESLTIKLDGSTRVVAIAPWAYSAQSNGTGSFRKYAVTLVISDGTNHVKIEAVNANDNDTVYTCVPGIISVVDGRVTVAYDEKYSARGSENRPAWSGTRLVMDAGPRNNYK
jgi:tellurite resistance protein TerA